jgi:cupin 2 domain-containing protein
MNIYEIADPEQGSESFVTLHQKGSLKIEAIRSRLTFSGEEYIQEEDEWVILVRGTAKLEIEGVERLLRAGDCLFLAHHIRHRVLFTSDDALWIGVFSS